MQGSRTQNAQIIFHPHSKPLLQALTRELWSREGKQTTACCLRKNQGLMTIGSATLGLRYFTGAIRGAQQLKRGRPSSSTDRRPDELILLYCQWDVREILACSWQRPVSSLRDTRDLSSSVQPAQVYNTIETTSKETGGFLLSASGGVSASRTQKLHVHITSPTANSATELVWWSCKLRLEGLCNCQPLTQRTRCSLWFAEAC